MPAPQSSNTAEFRRAVIAAVPHKFAVDAGLGAMIFSKMAIYS